MFELVILIVLSIVLFVIYKSYKKRKFIGSKYYNMIQHNSQMFQRDLINLKSKYISFSDIERMLDQYYELSLEFYNNKYLFSNMTAEMKNFKENYFDLPNLAFNWNQEYIQNELKESESLLNDVDNKSLDHQQRQAVITDEDNNLVIAGAGSGKTLTIAGKVKYLVQRKEILPDNILLITFTKKASEEMKERIVNDLGIGVQTTTFHKLGLDIISHQRGFRPEISDKIDEKLTDFFINKVLGNNKLIEDIITYFGFYQSVPRSYDDIKNLDELYKSYKHMNLETLKSTINRKMEEGKQEKKTLKRETVKSFEEVLIANFLYLNGIEYEYEPFYPYAVNDRFRKKYRPDFYLPEYSIYIEHFGLNENLRAPWLNEIEEEKYLDGVDWKRETHTRNSTTLVETFSYYNQNNELLIKLEEKLLNNAVIFSKPDFNNIYGEIFLKEQEENYFKETKKLLSTFINLFKSQGLQLNDFQKLEEEMNQIENPFLQKRSLLFLHIAKEAYKHYEDLLYNNNEIDFNDMIIESTSLINDKSNEENNQFTKFEYIIIDEFQDISVSRFNLINSIKNKSGSKILSVGDDWQSIYRFAGSDLDLFLNFNNYVDEATESLKIERTFRNSQELIDIAGQFIMENSEQINKNLVSNHSNNHPILIYGYNQDYYTAFIKSIENIVEINGDSSDVFVLGRNNFDKNKIIELSNGEVQLKKDAHHNEYLFVEKFPDLSVRFLTIHRSKGLQASNVIVINLNNDKLGFPNKVSDDPILSYVLSNSERFEFEEERRLFYVALTRTLNNVYLVTPEKDMSIFVNELIQKNNLVFNMVTNEEYNGKNPTCPKCEGVLLLKENRNDQNKFLGCSNYPFCDYTFEDISLLDNQIKCTNCEGYMIERKGRYGNFYGCENYPFCANTLQKTN